MRLDNHIDIAYNDDNIFTSSKLYPDPLYDPNENKTWWEQHWFEFIQNLVFTIALFVSVVLAACGHPQMLIFCIKAALIAAVSGAIIAGAITAYKGGDIEDVKYAIRQGAIDGFKSGFSMAAIAYGISSALKALASMKGAPNKAKANRGCPGEECFKEGTLVQTENGLKPIEDIQVGDKVLAYDEETGEQAYKPVKQLFRNTTQEWYHVRVHGEEIICTGGHPFYVANLDKFIPARELKVGNNLLLSDGSYAIIEEIQVERLEQSETTYNFEVEDFHTYYVTDSKILVHNMCAKQAFPKDRLELHNELLDRGYSPTSVADSGYVTYSHPNGAKVYIRSNGEVITVKRVWLPDGSRKIPIRYLWDGTPVPNFGHNTFQFVEPFSNATFVPKI